MDRDIECRVQVFVSPRQDYEIRLCEIANHGTTKRRLELTSYLEWVLGSHDGDANHPAFSKLFVETEFCAERQAILARRRPRSNDDGEFWGLHRVVADDMQTGLSFETNRMRFIGRGRTLARPQALDPGGKLSGDVGAVLDPIASLRLELTIEPGESHEVGFLVGAGQNRAAIEEILRSAADLSALRSALNEVKAVGLLNGHPTFVARPEFVDLSSPGRHIPASSFGADQRDESMQKRELQFDNGYGSFTADGREYVIRVRPDDQGNQVRPPMPWANVVANEHAGFLVTESGASYTWAGNSRINRLTAWHNDPVCDPHAEAFWIRDEDDDVFWSPTPGPTPSGGVYEVRHGFGYTAFASASHELSQELTLFMVRDDPVKIARLRITNRSDRTRRLSLFSFAHWALGGLASETGIDVATSYDSTNRAIFATNPHREHYGECVAFSAPIIGESPACEISHTGDRAAFVGRYRDIEAPTMVASADDLDGRTGQNLEPCAAWRISLSLPPGQLFECAFLLGEAENLRQVQNLLARYADFSAIDSALTVSQQFWRELLSSISIETPERELDVLVNGWLAYQNLSCRLWARSAYYQPGGAFGFRDQLQDSAALIYHRPEITRKQILRHASRQFTDGDVLHWWHPDTQYGVRTRFSDDLLWLPLVTAEYVARTGDTKLLDEDVPFVTAAPSRRISRRRICGRKRSILPPLCTSIVAARLTAGSRPARTVCP